MIRSVDILFSILQPVLSSLAFSLFCLTLEANQNAPDFDCDTLGKEDRLRGSSQSLFFSRYDRPEVCRVLWPQCQGWLHLGRDEGLREEGGECLQGSRELPGVQASQWSRLQENWQERFVGQQVSSEDSLYLKVTMTDVWSYSSGRTTTDVNRKSEADVKLELWPIYIFYWKNNKSSLTLLSMFTYLYS